MAKYRWLSLTDGDVESPPHDRVWKILGGYISHETGTVSTLSLKKRTEDVTASKAKFVFLCSILSATGTGNYSINPKTVTSIYIEEITTPCLDVELDWEQEFYFAGSSNAFCVIYVKEFKEK